MSLARADGEKLARIRAARRLTDEDLAARARVPVEFVRRAEAGYEVGARGLNRIAGALQLPLNDIIQRGSL